MPGILTLNVGSSTVKAAYFDAGDSGDAPWSAPARASIAVDSEGADGNEFGDLGLSRLLAQLPEGASHPARVAHRIVHGGHHAAPVVVTDALIAELSALSPLAPLHQAAGLWMLEDARRRWPNALQIAAFDTSWHSTIAPWSRRLPIPASLHAQGVMRYGFHGLAFASTMRQLEALDPVIAKARLVLLHLGGGSSICAVAAGRSVDTTMGMTPLDGVPMATRSGTLDPGVVLHLAQAMDVPLPQIADMLWRESGLKGVSGFASDMRTLLASPAPDATLAVDLFCVRVAQAVSAMATGLGGMDAIAFSGGIGEGAAAIRARIAAHLGWTGLRLDPEANEAGALQVHHRESTIAAYIVRIDEALELAIAAASTT